MSARAVKRVAVVGSGVGGLACAARLAHRGYAVDVYEKLSRCGGRAHVIEDQGYCFDTGPSFVLMPDFYAEVYRDCGQEMAQRLPLLRLDTHYAVFYPDGRQVRVFHDEERTAEELERREPGAARRYRDFLRDTGAMYQAVKPLMYRQFTPAALADVRNLRLLPALQVGATCWQLAGRYFRSEALRCLMTFESMFIGVSPFSAPAFYSVICYADHAQKLFHPRGGMYRIPASLEAIGREKGCRYHYDCEISGIRRESNGGFLLKQATNEYTADAVVVNADLPYARQHLLQRRIAPYRYSCSVMLFYWGVRRPLAGLEHHNIFFAADVCANMRRIFEDSRWPEDPSFYVHVPTKTDPSLAPPGKEIVYVLVPVPNLRQAGADPHAAVEKVRQLVLEKLRQVCGVEVEQSIDVEHRFYPRDFITRYNALYAATFGLSHSLFQSAFFRPANTDPKLDGLYYVGCSTQPGTGIPPVLAGSKIAADLISARGG
ncbi:MAG: phytoene desaturase family protein [Candidatus Omnitrophica bacterium]|nr:phytoene desaturase family protein [Candidatus Omnitrophota bacterium]